MLAGINHFRDNRFSGSEGSYHYDDKGNRTWVPSRMSVENSVVDVILEHFNSLPNKCKPARYDIDEKEKDVKEWTVLSGIAIVRPDDSVQCVALATGTKCISREKVAEAKGFRLHDSHAETLAIRTFNRYLMDEILKMSSHRTQNSTEKSESIQYESDIISWRDPCTEALSERNDNWQPPFKLREDIRIFMYCSEVPCGDASMELVMSRQEDDTPWPSDGAASTATVHQAELQGRSNFSQLGIVRRKPARPDSPQTGSKSCSDKLALKQCTSLLSCLTSAFITPDNAYIDTLVIPKLQFYDKACERSFGQSGRMKPVSNKQWANGYRFHPFRVSTTTRLFAFSRTEYPDGLSDLDHVWPREGLVDRTRKSNIAAIWNPYLTETIINGILQGRKHNDPKGASAVSRVMMMDLALRVESSFDTNEASVLDQTTVPPPQPQCTTKPKSPSPRTLEGAYHLVDLKNAPAAPGLVDNEDERHEGGGRAGLFTGAVTYYQAKGDKVLEQRRKVKKDVIAVALRNWSPNECDDFPIGLSLQ